MTGRVRQRSEHAAGLICYLLGPGRQATMPASIWWPVAASSRAGTATAAERQEARGAASRAAAIGGAGTTCPGPARVILPRQMIAAACTRSHEQLPAGTAHHRSARAGGRNSTGHPRPDGRGAARWSGRQEPRLARRAAAGPSPMAPKRCPSGPGSRAGRRRNHRYTGQASVDAAELRAVRVTVFQQQMLAEPIRAAGLARRAGFNLNQAVARLNATGQAGLGLDPAVAYCVRVIRHVDKAALIVMRRLA